MLDQAPNENIIPMLGHKLLEVIQILCIRKWSDTEITDDLVHIREILGNHIDSITYSNLNKYF